MPAHACVQRGSLKKCQGELLHVTAHRATKVLTHGAITVIGQGWLCTICPTSHTTRGQRFFPNFNAALNHERTVHDHEPAASKNDGNANDADEIRVSQNHPQTSNENCWDEIGQPRLTSEGLRQWQMHAHVDHVFDMVPFWQRGIDAAEKGEVLRLEEFLEKMEGDGGWRTANEVLGMLGGKVPPSERGWGQRHDWAAGQYGAWGSNAFDWAAAGQRGGWGDISNAIASDVTESSHGRDSGWGIREKWAEDVPDPKMCNKDGWGSRVRAGAVGGGGRAELHQFADVIARQEAVNEERRKQMHLFFEVCFVVNRIRGSIDWRADAHGAEDPED